MNLIEHLRRQRAWSEQTFGPGPRTLGVTDHIRKELLEIELKPDDLSEWIDVAILALDGAWRAGYTPEEIVAALEAKQTKNESRAWPDWRAGSPDKAIEHMREVVHLGPPKCQNCGHAAHPEKICREVDLFRECGCKKNAMTHCTINHPGAPCNVGCTY